MSYIHACIFLLTETPNEIFRYDNGDIIYGHCVSEAGVNLKLFL